MITQKKWGALEDGRPILLYEMCNATGCSVSVTNLGGIITSIIVPDRSGILGDVVLGYDTPEEYIADSSYMGAMIGRYANRIADGKFSLNGITWNLTKNQHGNTLHGGMGFHKKLWDSEIRENSVLLHYYSPHGEDGFPGNVDVSILCTLTDNNCFTMEMTACSDRDTVCCLTNHTYFNLSGGGNTLSHLFRIYADEYTPLDGRGLPEGKICSVVNTPYDFRHERVLETPKIDINYVVQRERQYNAVVKDPNSGRKLAVSSDLPGLQFYTAGGLAPRKGKNGSTYGPNSGFCLEPQFFPDSPNIPTFPSCTLKQGELYNHTISYCFSIF